MPDYTIKIKTDAVLDKAELEMLEYAIHDELVNNLFASPGITDVHATFD